MTKKEIKPEEEKEDEEEESEEEKAAAEIIEKYKEKAKQIQKEKDTVTKPPVSAPTMSAFEYVRSLGYTNYVFAVDFEPADLNTDARSYPIAKDVRVLRIREDDGSLNYIGLAFIGILDDPLFLILMQRDKAIESAKKITPNTEYVGLQFNGLTKHFGNVALASMSKKVFEDLTEKLEK